LKETILAPRKKLDSIIINGDSLANAFKKIGIKREDIVVSKKGVH